MSLELIDLTLDSDSLDPSDDLTLDSDSLDPSDEEEDDAEEVVIQVTLYEDFDDKTSDLDCDGRISSTRCSENVQVEEEVSSEADNVQCQDIGVNTDYVINSVMTTQESLHFQDEREDVECDILHADTDSGMNSEIFTLETHNLQEIRDGLDCDILGLESVDTGSGMNHKMISPETYSNEDECSAVRDLLCLEGNHKKRVIDKTKEDDYQPSQKSFSKTAVTSPCKRKGEDDEGELRLKKSKRKYTRIKTRPQDVGLQTLDRFCTKKSPFSEGSSAKKKQEGFCDKGELKVSGDIDKQKGADSRSKKQGHFGHNNIECPQSSLSNIKVLNSGTEVLKEGTKGRLWSKDDNELKGNRYPSRANGKDVLELKTSSNAVKSLRRSGRVRKRKSVLHSDTESDDEVGNLRKRKSKYGIDRECFSEQPKYFYGCGCGFTTLFLKDLQDHFKVCVFQPNCIHCGFKTRKLQYLFPHLDRHLHHFNCLYKCPSSNCGFGTDIAGKFYEHISIDDHAVLICSNCSEIFMDLDKLIEHHLENQILYVWCRKCDAVACSKQVMIDHLKSAHRNSTSLWTMTGLLCKERNKHGYKISLVGHTVVSDPNSERISETGFKERKGNIQDTTEACSQGCDQNSNMVTEMEENDKISIDIVLESRSSDVIESQDSESEKNSGQQTPRKTSSLKNKNSQYCKQRKVCKYDSKPNSRRKKHPYRNPFRRRHHKEARENMKHCQETKLSRSRNNKHGENKTQIEAQIGICDIVDSSHYNLMSETQAQSQGPAKMSKFKETEADGQDHKETVILVQNNKDTCDPVQNNSCLESEVNEPKIVDKSNEVDNSLQEGERESSSTEGSSNKEFKECLDKEHSASQNISSNQPVVHKSPVWNLGRNITSTRRKLDFAFSENVSIYDLMREDDEGGTSHSLGSSNIDCTRVSRKPCGQIPTSYDLPKEAPVLEKDLTGSHGKDDLLLKQAHSPTTNWEKSKSNISKELSPAFSNHSTGSLLKQLLEDPFEEEVKISSSVREQSILPDIKAVYYSKPTISQLSSELPILQTELVYSSENKVSSSTTVKKETTLKEVGFSSEKNVSVRKVSICSDSIPYDTFTEPFISNLSQEPHLLQNKAMSSPNKNQDSICDKAMFSATEVRKSNSNKTYMAKQPDCHKEIPKKTDSSSEAGLDNKTILASLTAAKDDTIHHYQMVKKQETDLPSENYVPQTGNAFTNIMPKSDLLNRKSLNLLKRDSGEIPGEAALSTKIAASSSSEVAGEFAAETIQSYKTVSRVSNSEDGRFSVSPKSTYQGGSSEVKSLMEPVGTDEANELCVVSKDPCKKPAIESDVECLKLAYDIPLVKDVNSKNHLLEKKSCSNKSISHAQLLKKSTCKPKRSKKLASSSATLATSDVILNEIQMSKHRETTSSELNPCQKVHEEGSTKKLLPKDKNFKCSTNETSPGKTVLMCNESLVSSNIKGQNAVATKSSSSQTALPGIASFVKKTNGHDSRQMTRLPQSYLNSLSHTPKKKDSMVPQTEFSLSPLSRANSYGQSPKNQKSESKSVSSSAKYVVIPDGDLYPKAVKCFKCPFSSMIKKNLERHIRSCHPGIDMITGPSSPSSATAFLLENVGEFLDVELLWLYENHEEFYVCVICKKVLSSKFLLHAHLLDHLQVSLGRCLLCDTDQCRLAAHHSHTVWKSPDEVVQEIKQWLLARVGTVKVCWKKQRIDVKINEGKIQKKPWTYKTGKGHMIEICRGTVSMVGQTNKFSGAVSNIGHTTNVEDVQIGQKHSKLKISFSTDDEETKQEKSNLGKIYSQASLCREKNDEDSQWKTSIGESQTIDSDFSRLGVDSKRTKSKDVNPKINSDVFRQGVDSKRMKSNDVNPKINSDVSRQGVDSKRMKSNDVNPKIDSDVFRPCLGTEQLNQHLETLIRRDGQKNNCAVCCACFTSIYSCHRHLLNKHLHFSPFTCSICGFGATERYDAAWHMRTKHPLEPLCLFYHPPECIELSLKEP